MGSLSEMQQRDRFIEEFGPELLQKCRLPKGTVLKVKSGAVNVIENSGEVAIFYDLEGGGESIEVSRPLGIVVDEEDDAYMAEALATSLDADYDEILARVRKVSEGDDDS